MISTISKKRIGCLGLSANPPHLGHLAAAQAVLKSRLVDEVWLIPVYAHPFNVVYPEQPVVSLVEPNRGVQGKPFNKQEFAPWHHRVAMTKLLERPGIVACEIEGELQRVSYTADTVAALQNRYPEYEFLWIIGSDIVARGEYLRWHNWDALKTMIEFIVVDRPGYPIYEGEIPEGSVRISDRKVGCQSSTLARELIHGHEDVASIVGDQIMDYIKRNGLYSNNTKEAHDDRD